MGYFVGDTAVWLGIGLSFKAALKQARKRYRVRLAKRLGLLVLASIVLCGGLYGLAEVLS